MYAFTMMPAALIFCRLPVRRLPAGKRNLAVKAQRTVVVGLVVEHRADLRRRSVHFSNTQ